MIPASPVSGRRRPRDGLRKRSPGGGEWRAPAVAGDRGRSRVGAPVGREAEALDLQFEERLALDLEGGDAPVPVGQVAGAVRVLSGVRRQTHAVSGRLRVELDGGLVGALRPGGPVPDDRRLADPWSRRYSLDGISRVQVCGRSTFRA